MISDAAPIKAARAAAGALRRGVRHIAANDVLLASLILGVLIVVFFYDIVFLGRTLVTSALQWGVMGTSTPFGYPGDRPDPNLYLLDPLASAVAAEPTMEKVAGFLRQFQLPLWDASLALGRPLLATMDPSAVSPIRLPLMISPSPEMWDAFLMGRLFVAGLFTYLLAKRLGLAKSASFGAGVAFSFSGYFMLYVNQPHADFAMMIPVLLYPLELLLERPGPGRVALAAAAVALGVLVNNPETAVVLLLFGAAYYLARAFVEARSDRLFRFWPRVLLFGLAAGAGVGLTAFTMLPFLELSGALGGSGLALHRHTPDLGIGANHDPLQFLISLFVPFFDGPPVDNFQGTGWTGIRNYVGVVIPLLALAGVWNRPAMRKHGFFFLGATIVLLSKTYGVPAVNWVGHLPILNVIDLSLYLAPTIAFSLAMLAGLGLDQVSRGGWRWGHVVVAVVILGSLLGWLVWINRGILGNIPDTHLVTQFAFAGSLIVATGAVLLATSRGLMPSQAGTAVLVALIAAELFTFTTPIKSEFAGLASAVYEREDFIERPLRYDPFTKPPYVSFLQEDTSKYRVFGLDYVLYPNASRAYEIDDIRGFTATTVERYFRFVRQFINPSVRSRFTGAYLPPLQSEGDPPRVADNPMFDLLNVKYILTPRGLPQAYDYQLTERILTVNDTKGATVRSDVFTIDGEDDVVLFQHPISSLSYDLTPNEQSRFLLFRLAMDPQVWQPDLGDGVLFEVSVREGESEETLFSRWVDPKNNPADRRWIDGTVDLNPYLGRPVTLILSTSPGETPASDWAGWGGLRLTPSPETPPDRSSSSQFDLVYDREVKIYENRDAFPRAFVVHRALLAGAQDPAIALMKRPDFDPNTKAVVEGDLSSDQLAALAASPVVDSSSVELTSYSDNRVNILARMEHPGLLILSDTYYPGWKAYVDGKEVPVYPTDLALRSVFVPAGEHEVKFVFSPDLFKLGSGITITSLALLMMYAAWAPAKRTVMGLLRRRSRES